MPRRGLTRALALALLLASSGGCALFRGGGDPPVPVLDPAPAARADSTRANDEAATARASTDETPIESVSVVLTPEERERLLGEAKADLTRVTELCRDVDASALAVDSQEKLRAIERLVVSANEALEGDDPVAAANLSHKARLLAEELVEG